uniref:Tc1-like transposase DDE domain-containing protein n=1 Tax=Cyprinus carpio TaxID=7962 RepID=A0A8C1ZWF6_CYPCA
MAQTNEISEDLRKRVGVVHQTRKGFKAFFKQFGLHKSTVRQTVYQECSTNKEHSRSKICKSPLGLSHIEHCCPTAHKNHIPSVRHGVSIMVWLCFAASGPGRLAIIDGTMNSELYKANVRSKWLMQQDNDPKHTSYFTKGWLKKNKVNVLEWPSQIPALNPIEMLWKDLKQAWFCTEEWAKIPTNRCAGQISSYKKHYPQLLLQKGVRPDTESKDSHTVATFFFS